VIVFGRLIVRYVGIWRKGKGFTLAILAIEAMMVIWAVEAIEGAL